MILGKNAQNVQKITDLIKENPRTTLLELEQDTGISKTTIGRIATKDLKLKKTPAKFIPRFLTNEQKLCRLATCENMLEMTRTDPEWKDKIITGDETWVYDYDPETKRQYAEWRGQGQTVIKEMYLDILRHLREAIRKKMPEKWPNGDWILHHNNARPHTAHLMTRFLAKNGTEIRPQPPYSPDIAPNDFFLFPKLKAVLKGRHFDTRDDIIEKSLLALKSIPKELNKNCFDNLGKRWRWCVEARGDYFKTRYNFFSEVQEKNQSFDYFVTKVKNKAVDCDFGDLTESLIRDRIVLGVLDKKLTERYLQDPDLTLSKAIALGRAAESSRTQLKEIKEEVTLDKLSSYKETSSNKNTEHKFVKKNHKLFKACGKCASKHEYGNCPAYGVGLLKNKQSILIKEDAIPQRSQTTINESPCLRHFDPKLDIEISTDASSNGLGAVLQQQGVPITYSSTALSAAQKKYSQIEKELLAVYFGCKRNHLYLYGRKFTTLTDHKPLLTIMKKTMVDLSPRLQRLVLQLQHYDFDLKYIPGKKLYTADALSRDYIANDLFTTPEIEISQNNQVLMVTYSNNRHQDLVEATNNDPVPQEVKNYIENGWPIHKKTMNPLVKPFWDIKEELFEGRKYLGIVDYYTKYQEVFELRSTKAEMVIEKLKEVFARCGVPEIMMTDNGPPFQSTEMMEFAKEWNVTHTTSSPRFPQSNGMIERTIQTLKSTIIECQQSKQDIYQALLLLRNTEHSSLPSPAIMLYGRKQRLFLPMKTTLMNESRICEDSIRKQHEANQSRIKFHFNRHARDLSSLENGQSVLVRQEKQWSPAKVIAPGVLPRSYLLEDTKGSVLRRNRRDLRPAGTLSGLRKKKVLQKSKNNLTLNHLHLPRARRLQPQLEPDAED
ncbi:K02A2.6-like [Cordylochernes scorpioides]|uniref:K02A2.6-like n=1 Tax=Cordylochernes scorpioides TaxID=51811 RepID=A0ABY6KVY8_9ARAC|nr:K02A2.6-like [Cordylochernes scorpioides]